MHELSLCEGMLRIIRKEAEKQQFSKVSVVRLELGALCCAAPDALDFCFRVLTKGTLADGARLELVRMPGQAWCMNCGEMVTVADRLDNCPQCGSYEVHVKGDDHMRIQHLEVI